MSGAGTAARPKARFCWVCSKKLHGNFHRVVETEGGHQVVVHLACAEKEKLTIVKDAHLATKVKA